MLYFGKEKKNVMKNTYETRRSHYIIYRVMLGVPHPEIWYTGYSSTNDQRL